MLKILMIIVIIFFYNPNLLSAAEVHLQAEFPYLMDEKNLQDVATYSTKPLYINVESANNQEAEFAELEIVLPEKLQVTDPAWEITEIDQRLILKKKIKLEAGYGNNFQLIYLKTLPELPIGANKLTIELKYKDQIFNKELFFNHIQGVESVTEKKGLVAKSGWYLQSFILPVDNNGLKDERVDTGTIYIKDTKLENFRNKFLGEGATNWGKIYSHPATFASLELRNPQQDTRLLKFKAELIDKLSGEVIPGLTTAGPTNDNQEKYQPDNETASMALLALSGQKNQLFTLPLYIDHAQIIPGEYNLRITLASEQEEKIRELPIKIIKNKTGSFYVLTLAGFSLIFVTILMFRIHKTINKIGAKGSITVALFAAISFGCITVPTTLFGDLLHVFLGPFSSFITGLLSGVVFYSLLISLLVLYREFGVVALLFILKWLLAALLFGRITPLGILMCAVNIVFLEIALKIVNFYETSCFSNKKIIIVSIALGIADALITYVNLEQMMFFYRLYYADWYIALQMLLNGVIYSSVGVYFGFKLGAKLQQIMGE